MKVHKSLHKPLIYEKHLFNTTLKGTPILHVSLNWAVSCFYCGCIHGSETPVRFIKNI